MLRHSLLRPRFALRLAASAPRMASSSPSSSPSPHPPLDYPSLLSASSRLRQPSAIRALQPLLATPGIITLGGGMPAPELFPFEKVTAQCSDPFGGPSTPITLEGPTLREALQYSPSWGLERLLKQLRALQLREHGDTVKDWKIMVTTGSQEALTKSFEMLLDPGTPLLVESPTYSGALAGLRPMQANLLPVPLDEQGVLPQAFEEIVLKQKATGKPVRVFYTIPTGQNPSGVTTSQARREALYALCEKHNILILEDDPYWFLQFNPSPSLRSYASMDRSGRVLRFDSFSKVLSAGMRVGYVSGPAPLLERLELHQQASTLHPSGLSQALVAALLELWGEQGFARHLAKVRAHYLSQCRAFLASAERHLKPHADWSPPSAGMFVWLKLKGINDTKALIEKEAVAAKVLLVPGGAFDPLDRPSSYVRAAFSTSTPEQMEEAVKRLAALLQSKLPKA